MMITRKIQLNFERYDAIHIECGEHFIAWDKENFIKHMEWVEKAMQAEKELSQLKQNLKGIEWVEKWTSEGYSLVFCPACGVDKRSYDFDKKVWVDNQHKPDCWINAIGEG